jgi:ATP-binding cassette subfamily F protein 3
MLNFTHLALRRGSRTLFEDANFTVHSGEKVGITGANGTGKSSLFRLIRAELQADAGELTLPPRLVIAHVAQETPAVDRPAIEYVMDGDTELRTVQAALAQAERTHDGDQLAALHARFETIDGYTARSRAAQLLDGLGFRPDQIELPVMSFSGGWRMRLNLAQALMCRSDLLLLDEPTNHLDLDAVLWLEEWLRSYRGTLLLVSHDRDFLDRVVDHIAHIEQQRVGYYTGNYSAFEIRRAADLARQQASYQKQQREAAHIRAYVERFRAKATKARQAQSRLKALSRMEIIAAAHVDSPFHFAFRPPERLPNPLLRLTAAAVGYGEHEVLSDVTLSVAPGDRLGLLGPNGAGKSTLIKLLAGEHAPRRGKREEAQHLRLGYFAQHQLEQLRADDSVLAHLQRLDAGAREQDLRDYLGGFGFAGDTVLAPVAPLSGGEKARLVLAMLVYQRPNLLLLDEPTNHLDLEMREALAQALQDYEGALVVVSHDRHLLRTVADDLLLVADLHARPFDGDLDDYAQWLAARRIGAVNNDDKREGEHSAVARKERRRQDAQLRARLQPLRKEIDKLEAGLARLQAQKAALVAALSEPAIYADAAKEKLKRLLLEQGRVDKAIGETETAWLAACEALEAAESEVQ